MAYSLCCQTYIKLGRRVVRVARRWWAELNLTHAFWSVCRARPSQGRQSVDWGGITGNRAGGWCQRAPYRLARASSWWAGFSQGAQMGELYAAVPC